MSAIRCARPAAHPSSRRKRSFRRTLLVALGLLAMWQAARSEDIVVGQVLSLTGSTGPIGQDLKAGSEVCVGWINANGAAGAGNRLRLLTLDDAGDPARTLPLARSLVEQSGATVLLGPLGPAAVAAMLPWAAEQRVAVVGPHAGDVGSRLKEWDTGFFLTANHSVEGQRLADHLKSLNVSRVSIIRADDGLGARGLVAFEEALSTAGVEVSQTVTIKSDGSGAADAVRRLLEKAPPAIVLATSGRATLEVLRALSGARASESFYGVYGLSFAATSNELASLGLRARGLVMTQVLPPVTETRHRLVSVYRQAMAGAGRQDLSATGLEGCLGPLVLAEVLRTRPQREASRTAILRALQSTASLRIGDFEIPLANHDMPGSTFSDIVIVDGHGRVAH